MKTVMPPSGGGRLDIKGRVYSSPDGVSVTMPDGDALVAAANGWGVFTLVDQKATGGGGFPLKNLSNSTVADLDANGNIFLQFLDAEQGPVGRLEATVDGFPFFDTLQVGSNALRTLDPANGDCAAQFTVGADDVNPRTLFKGFANLDALAGAATWEIFAYRGSITEPTALQAGDYIFPFYQYSPDGSGGWSQPGQWNLVCNGMIGDIATGYWGAFYYSDLTAKGQGMYLWSPQDETAIWWVDGGSYSAIAMPTPGQFAIRLNSASTDSTGTSMDAGGYKVGGVAGFTGSKGPTDTTNYVGGIAVS